MNKDKYLDFTYYGKKCKSFLFIINGYLVNKYLENLGFDPTNISNDTFMEIRRIALQNGDGTLKYKRVNSIYGGIKLIFDNKILEDNKTLNGFIRNPDIETEYSYDGMNPMPGNMDKCLLWFHKIPPVGVPLEHYNDR